ncbi:MAG TPA: enolase C-terminal domain-like protein [Candidatus Limnocylindrales bacterium]|nr:enolase C-terminal domain-like protein [Candidatus Limnocylindrales bacterium]
MATSVARHPDLAAPSGRPAGHGPVIDRVAVSAFTIPTDAPESDGTFAWDRTTIVVVEPEAGGVRGLGYSYADATAGRLIADVLRDDVVGRDALDTSAAWSAMVGAVRNIGRPGIAATAISAVDNALWDLKARLLGVPLASLLGRARDAIPAYGSGGFCSYDDARLARQLGGWADDGFRFVKMKVGRDPSADAHRVDVARSAIGDAVGLFVDANGAFDGNRALAFADLFAEHGVTWFEEPVSSDDVAGLRLLRDRAPAGMAIAAGEYGWDQFDFRALLEAGAVDVLQADATRCLGTTGFLMAAALCEAHDVPLSAHCAPALHLPLTCAARPAVHLEWFHDHVRIEHLIFDGAPDPHDGLLAPDLSRPGLGLELRRSDAEPYLTWRSE